MEEHDLTKLCKKYGLPSMEYSKKLRHGDGTFDRQTGKIQMSESLRYASEAEILRVALHEAGHFNTCSFVGEVLPFYAAIGFFLFLAVCLVMPEVRAFVPSGIPFFGAVLMVLVFETGRQRGERAANRWAKQHWPDDLSVRGELYF